MTAEIVGESHAVAPNHHLETTKGTWKMVDNFKDLSSNLTSPGTRHYPITPNDNVALDPLPRCLYVKVGGNVAVEDASGTVIIYPLATGDRFDFRVVKILETGTDPLVELVGWE